MYRSATASPSDPSPQNLDTIESIRERTARRIDGYQRFIESMTAGLGRPLTLYVVLTLVAAWIGVNLGFSELFGRFAVDPPPFFWLQGAVALSALLMTTLVLITENRQTRHAEERAHLELQVNLLSEQKVTKLIALVEELRRDLPMVRDRIDREAQAMQEPLDPHAVLSALESTAEGVAPES